MSSCTLLLCLCSVLESLFVIWGSVSVYRLWEYFWGIKCKSFIYILHVLHVHCIIYIVLLYFLFQSQNKNIMLKKEV